VAAADNDDTKEDKLSYNNPW